MSQSEKGSPMMTITYESGEVVIMSAKDYEAQQDKEYPPLSEEELAIQDELDEQRWIDELGPDHIKHEFDNYIN